MQTNSRYEATIEIKKEDKSICLLIYLGISFLNIDEILT